MSYSVPSSAKPFTLNVSDQDFSEFKQLLQLSKVGPLTWEGKQEDRRFGTTHKWLSETKEYWLNKYDWRAHEKHINSFPQYTMEIEGLNTHFVALLSEKKDAIPIVFMHGWPGSFIEFLPMLGLIKEKYSSSDLPYHIIVPSLSGYTLSSSPLDKDWTKFDTARIVDKLMNNLGFSKYVAQGGDVGSFVATVLATQYDSCVAIHLNMLRQSETPAGVELQEYEKKALEKSAEWRTRGTGYALEHGTRPSTIGLVLSSSPLALLAWIGEKMLEWSDTDPSLDTILTNVTLYWFTQSFPRSIYPYRESFGKAAPPPAPPYIEKPFGYSWYRYEITPGLKVQLEKVGNLVFYKQHESGGHFAALEKPKEMLGDVEEFVKVAWKLRDAKL